MSSVDALSLQENKTCFLTLYKTKKSLGWSKLKAFADNKINVTVKLKFVLGRVKTLWERRKCW